MCYATLIPVKCNTKMLVIGAANDAIFKPLEINMTARMYNADKKIIPNIAHDMMLEENWKSVAKLIVDWLDGLPPNEL